MPVTEVSRELSAPPVSAALLLTSADALEWWPGLRLASRPGPGLDLVAGPTALAATLTRGRVAESVAIEALPPRRTPTAFVAAFTVRGGTYADTDGAVTLAYRPEGSRATITLSGPRGDLAGPARRFLDRLAREAEDRSTAA